MPPTIAKARRQLIIWLNQVAKGLPTSMAIVSPDMTRLTACARLCVGTSEAATRDATPK